MTQYFYVFLNYDIFGLVKENSLHSFFNAEKPRRWLGDCLLLPRPRKTAQTLLAPRWPTAGKKKCNDFSLARPSINLHPQLLRSSHGVDDDLFAAVSCINVGRGEIDVFLSIVTFHHRWRFHLIIHFHMLIQRLVIDYIRFSRYFLVVLKSWN